MRKSFALFVRFHFFFFFIVLFDSDCLCLFVFLFWGISAYNIKSTNKCFIRHLYWGDFGRLQFQCVQVINMMLITSLELNFVFISFYIISLTFACKIVTIRILWYFFILIDLVQSSWTTVSVSNERVFQTLLVRGVA